MGWASLGGAIAALPSAAELLASLPLIVDKIHTKKQEAGETRHHTSAKHCAASSHWTLLCGRVGRPFKPLVGTCVCVCIFFFFFCAIPFPTHYWITVTQTSLQIMLDYTWTLKGHCWIWRKILAYKTDSYHVTFWQWEHEHILLHVWSIAKCRVSRKTNDCCITIKRRGW